MFPKKLKNNDEIRVIAPSHSLSIVSAENRANARKRFEELGFKLSFSKNVAESDEFASSSVASRVADLHEAFLDKNVKAIFAVIGGLNANQILKYLDYDLIKNNPKIFCGYSDITALSNAIFHKSGLVTYSGPCYSTFSMLKGFDFTLEYFKKCLMEEENFEVIPSSEWSDDAWYLDQEKRDFIKNQGYFLINEGEAEGKILGGNLSTFSLLQGTEFFPDLSDTLLFIEDDEESYDGFFDRNLQSLIHQSDFYKVKGIIIGRFQKASGISNQKLTKIIKTKRELDNIPVIANADFGHTAPLITFPIGGRAKLSAKNESIKLEIIKH